MTRIFSCIIPHAGKAYAGDARSDVFKHFNNITEIIYVTSLHNTTDAKGVYVLKDDLNMFSNNNWVIKSNFPEGVLNEHSYNWTKDELPAKKHTVIVPTSDYPIEKLSIFIQQYLLNNNNALLVGTTDLIHYGQNYSKTDWKGHEQHSKIKHEAPLIKALQSCDDVTVSNLFKKNKFLGCGQYSVTLISNVCKKLKCQGTVVSYYDSNQSKFKHNDIERYSFSTPSNNLTFVSYVGMIFSETKQTTDIDVKLALGAIRSVINTTITNSKILDHEGYIPSWTEWYSMKNGVFVGTSVYRNGENKTNCSTGKYQSDENTAINIINSAGNCYKDSTERWRIPLTSNGNVNYKLEILQDMKDWKKIKAKDITKCSKNMDYGYYLTFNNRSATYLPDVWRESLPNEDAEGMLSNLAGKAIGKTSTDEWKSDQNAYVKLYKSCKINYDSKNKIIINKCKQNNIY